MAACSLAGKNQSAQVRAVSLMVTSVETKKGLFFPFREGGEEK